MVRMETMGVGFCPNGEQRQIHRLWDQCWRILGCSGGGGPGKEMLELALETGISTGWIPG